MRYGWARAAVVTTLALALTACGERAGASDETAAENLRASEFFLASNARAEGVRVLPSGVQYKIVTSGPTGSPSPDSNDLVRVDYEGSLTDGTVFDSSFQRGQPAVFSTEDGLPGLSVVEGWREALQAMHVGDEWIVYLPPAKGYGEQGQGEIPPNAVLVFRLKLLELDPVPGGNEAAATANG